MSNYFDTTTTRYAVARSLRDIKRHQGFDFRGRTLLRTTDPGLYKNPRIRKFAITVERVINMWYTSVEELANIRNPAKDPRAADGVITVISSSR